MVWKRIGIFIRANKAAIVFQFSHANGRWSLATKCGRDANLQNLAFIPFSDLNHRKNSSFFFSFIRGFSVDFPPPPQA